MRFQEGNLLPVQTYTCALQCLIHLSAFNMYKSPLLAIFSLSQAISICIEFLESFINMQTKPHNIIDINLQVFRFQGLKLMSFSVSPQELTGL